ncbi:MAG TPA: hypothetical protein DCO71_04235 [Gammaproteobacteria bacterium]|nr:hypothetical protein [Gammaproteobacteria bacterium]
MRRYIARYSRPEYEQAGLQATARQSISSNSILTGCVPGSPAGHDKCLDCGLYDWPFFGVAFAFWLSDRGENREELGGGRIKLQISASNMPFNAIMNHVF